MSRGVRTAVVGLGWVGVHRHLPALAADPAFDVVGVIDRHPGRAQAVAARLGLRRHHAAERLTDVPWLEEVEAFTIATAPMSHAALIREALSLGRHVLTEKPFVLDPADGEALVALARERGRVLAIVHNF